MESVQELRAALWAVQDYCETWKLEVNAQKTKVVIFSRGKVQKIPMFIVNDIRLEEVSHFPYLGVTLNYNGKFNLCKRKLYSQAQRVMYSVLQKSRTFLCSLVGLWVYLLMFSWNCFIALLFQYSCMALKSWGGG